MAWLNGQTRFIFILDSLISESKQDVVDHIIEGPYIKRVRLTNAIRVMVKEAFNASIL